MLRNYEQGEWKMNKDELNLGSFGQKLIITGLARLVEEKGYTPHEAFDCWKRLKEIRSMLFLEIPKEWRENTKP